jgi:hypothetical protein
MGSKHTGMSYVKIMSHRNLWPTETEVPQETKTGYCLQDIVFLFFSLGLRPPSFRPYREVNKMKATTWMIQKPMPQNNLYRDDTHS